MVLYLSTSHETLFTSWSSPDKAVVKTIFLTSSPTDYCGFIICRPFGWRLSHSIGRITFSNSLKFAQQHLIHIRKINCTSEKFVLAMRIRDGCWCFFFSICLLIEASVISLCVSLSFWLKVLGNALINGIATQFFWHILHCSWAATNVIFSIWIFGCLNEQILNCLVTCWSMQKC